MHLRRLVLGLLVLLAGCGASPTADPVNLDPTATLPPPGITVLRVATGDGGVGLTPHLDIITRFEAENPDIQVELEPVNSEQYYEDLLAKIRSGDTPDLVQIGDDALPRFVAAGALLPLDPAIGGQLPLDTSIYLEGVLEPGQWQGQQYLLPKDFTPLGIFYNKKIFDELGVAYPEDDWTWDEFLATAQQLTFDTDGNGEPNIYGVQLPGPWTSGFEYWVKAAGGALVGPDGQASGAFDSAESQAALQFYADLYQRYRVAPPPVDFAQFSGGNNEFSEGRAAMLLMGRWPQDNLRSNPEIELGVVGVPIGREQANILLWGGFGITAQSKHPEAAWRFLRYYAGAQGAEIWQNWGLPSVAAVSDAAGLADDPIEGVWLGEIAHVAPRAYLSQPEWNDIGDPILRELLITLISDPSANVEQLSGAAAAAIDEGLAD